MVSRRYAIPDDPTPTRLRAIAVHPQWPLLSVMVAGVWLGWPWLAFNSFALGSATLRRELSILGVGLLGAVASAFAVLFALDQGWLTNPFIVRFLLLGVVIWKIAVGYSVVALQTRCHSTYEFNGGTTRNGVLVVIAGAVARTTVLGAFSSLLWKLVVSGVLWL